MRVNYDEHYLFGDWFCGGSWYLHSLVQTAMKIKLKKKKPNIKSQLDPMVERINFGILNVTTDETIQYVKNCKTGWPILRMDAELVGKDKDDQYLWKRKGERVTPELRNYPSVWKEGEQP